MRKLTQDGQQVINNLANNYGVSTDAVMCMLDAVSNGGGTMAQFNIPELGGGGQWMQGGMTMVGDMFNYGLKSTVDNLCSELSNLLAQQPFQADTPVSNNGSPVSLFAPGSSNSGNWWPDNLGIANSTGGQNNVRYAYFGDTRRLAVDINGNVTVYDTLDHQIGGVSQQQGSGSSFTFTSQYGTVDVMNLPIVSQNGVEVVQQPVMQENIQPIIQNQPQNIPQQNEFNNYAEPNQDVFSSVNNDDAIAMIERLAKLKDMGILTDSEFTNKKSDILNKI
ncbi:MAG: hypothetical protein ACJA0H_001333 [Francisellaceae bacterium]|jgi:hypothetical protein